MTKVATATDYPFRLAAIWYSFPSRKKAEAFRQAVNKRFGFYGEVQSVAGTPTAMIERMPLSEPRFDIEQQMAKLAEECGGHFSST